MLYRLESTIFLLIIAWSTWYLSTFYIRPRRQPFYPRSLPYFLPVVGNAVAFMRDSNALFDYARKYFGNTRQPFSLIVVGEELYIVTSPEDVSAVYRNTKALDFDPFIHNVAMAFGATRANADKMFEENSDHSRSFIQQSHENYKLQLHPGSNLEELQTAFLKPIDTHLSFRSISPKITCSSRHPETKLLSLFDWTSEVLLDSATHAFIEDHLLDTIQPDLLDSFFVFDDESWKLNYQYPRIAAKEMYKAKDKATAAFERYFLVSRSERPGAAWIIKTLEDDMRSLGMDTQQLASMIFMAYWVIKANAYKLAFWITAHLLRDPSLLAEVRKEIASCFSSTKLISLTHLFDSTPLLSSIYHESLRMYNAPMGARTVTAPCSLPSAPEIVLQPGRKLLMPYRQLHFDSDSWGANIDQFKPRRFLRSLGEKMKSGNPHFRPFGGGTTYCPGRFLAV